MPEDFPALCRRLLHRQRGIGAYEAAVLLSAAGDTVVSQVFDRRGLPSAFATDALRCLARYAYDAGLLEAEGADIVVGERAFTADLIDSSSIMMGLGVPTNLDRSELRESAGPAAFRSIEVAGASCTCTWLIAEGPQAVVFVPDYGLELSEIARALAAEMEEPARIGFVRVFSRNELQVRVFDETGREEPSSAAASAAALVAAGVGGLADRSATVHNRGGDLYVEWDERSGRLFVTAPVAYVFTGTVDTEDIDEQPR